MYDNLHINDMAGNEPRMEYLLLPSNDDEPT